MTTSVTTSVRTNLFDALGGGAAIEIAVDQFYQRLLDDSRVSHYFTNVDIRRQKRHMRAFLAAALGGPDLYRGRNMGEAHAHLGVTAAAWDTVVGHLVGTLTDLGVSPDLIGVIGARLTPLRDQIVSRP